MKSWRSATLGWITRFKQSLDRLKSWLLNCRGAANQEGVAQLPIGPVFLGTLVFSGLLVLQFFILANRDVTFTYFSIFTILAFILFLRWIHHRWLVDCYRREDSHYVRSQIIEANNAIARLRAGKAVGSADCEALPDLLQQEVDRLERIGLSCWQDWQILALSNLLVDCFNVHDLIGQARLQLDELEDYAGDTAYSLDREQYRKQERTIERAIDEIHDAMIRNDSFENRPPNWQEHFDEKVEALRAALRCLYEYVIEYEANWARGTILLSGLKFSCTVSIPVFLSAGLLPVTMPPSAPLNWFNWAFIGTSGALAAVLHSFLRSDEIEVGHATSRKEVSRALVAAVLGFASGTVFFAFAGSGLGESLLSEALVPNVMTVESVDIFLSVVWAFVAGFVFERVIDQVRQSLPS